jgi:hypothetical protein
MDADVRFDVAHVLTNLDPATIIVPLSGDGGGRPCDSFAGLKKDEWDQGVLLRVHTCNVREFA